MADTNITWNGTPIDNIERNSLSLARINEDSTIWDMVETINANFLNIAKHGGGPAGINGADGVNGADGSNVEYIYALCDEMNPGVQYPTDTDKIVELFNLVKSDESHPYEDVTWFDNAQPISPEHKNEYVWCRIKRGIGLTDWCYAPKPVLWSRWGEDGTDGDGVEYMFLLENFDTYNSPTEEEWNTFFSSNFTGDNVSDTAKYVYATSDFLPTLEWFNESNSSAIQTRMEADGKIFDNTVWNNLRKSINSRKLGSWKDNPGNVSSSKKYQYVSIRKMSDGEWGVFSYPKLWSKYAIIKFKSIAFAATTFDTDLSGCTVTGGNFSNPLPDLTKKGEQTIDVKWTDGPDPNESEGKTQIWMTSANVSEDSTSALVWSAPQKMTDTADLQVEWSSTDKSLTELVNINSSLTNSKYNFGTFLNTNNYSENAAELAWRTAMLDDFGISFGDNSENAILMATCQLKNDVWTNWKITRVKGEKGDAGTSVNIKDRIIYESYLTSGTEYNYENANNRRNTHTPDKTPENGDLLIVYPAEPNENGIYYGDASDGGKLYMWKYTNNWEDYNDPNSIGEETGNTYVSPNGHLILWDGDSWGDVGNIVGPEGKSYTIAVKYAKDGKNGEKEEITNELEIPNAKWIGTCVYEEGTTPPDIKDTSWKWSLFKGQDGYGYEYIFKPTSTKDSASIPQVPQMPSGGSWHTTPNIIPDGWTDDPIEPTETDRYIWMCWRKFDHSTQKWTDFMGVEGKTIAKLWHFYVTDGKPGEPGTPGEAGNGYQYKYIRYDNSINYGSTTCTVTNPSSNEPIFKIGAVEVSSTDSAQGVDSGHTYEYRSERYGHTGSWSNWSNPVIIARYLDDSDIQATVTAEVSAATESIQNSLNDANSRISTLTEKFDENGNLNVPLSDGIARGYLKTDENGNLLLSAAGVTTAPDGVTTFADYINHETDRFTTITNDINALEGTIEDTVTNVVGDQITSGFDKIQSDIHAEFATMERTVTKGSFVTDVEGYLLVEEDGTRRRALDKDNNPTKNYTDVIDSDKEKLIYVNSELSSISQMVNNGIASTSIVTTTDDGAAIFYEQVDESGSKIYMNANTIGIHSNYFSLDNSGLEMTGNLLAKDKGIITAGVFGVDTADNDIKFFAGTNAEMQDRSKAPFRVYEDGSLYAENATIKGNINATGGTFGGYVRMPYTYIQALNAVPDQYYTYYADERAYIVCDVNQGMGDGAILLLPNPTLELNGFTYHLITSPNIATKSSGQNYGLTIKTVDGDNHFDVYTCTEPICDVSTLCCFGGHIEITCVPTYYEATDAKWVMTQCTGGVDCMRINVPIISSVTSSWKYYGVNYHLKSPVIKVGEETWCRIDFIIRDTSKSIKITMRASSARDYNFGYIGSFDSDASSTSYRNRVDGDGTIEVVDTLTNGTHYVYVGYTKDVPSENNDDCVYVDITGATESLAVSICTLTGVSYEENNVVTKVMAQKTLPTKRKNDTIYIQRPSQTN